MIRVRNLRAPLGWTVMGLSVPDIAATVILSGYTVALTSGAGRSCARQRRGLRRGPGRRVRAGRRRRPERAHVRLAGPPRRHPARPFLVAYADHPGFGMALASRRAR